ncbi:hypothetical protein HK098_002596 [Nowakowskiella sp. JEL0407]|nr:hypothetical protein HK098_002596 [Nowakowskiella sp. JEL0407]
MQVIGSVPRDLETIRQEYRSSLADLTFNSKPIINNLTIIAHENIAASSVIVQTIEDQIRNAQPKQKLPVFYLLDSICKNVGGVYLTRFAQNLVRTFKVAYDAVDHDDRQRMAKVLVTWWNTGGVSLFPPLVLHQIEDIVKATNSHQIHVNPNFMGIQSSALLYPTANTLPFTSIPQIPVNDNSVIQQEIQAVLNLKQQLLIISPTLALTNEIALLGQLLNLVRTTVLDQNMVTQIRSKLREITPQTPAIPLPIASTFNPISLSTAGMLASSLVPSANPIVTPTPTPIPAAPTGAPPAIDFANLSKLISNPALLSSAIAATTLSQGNATKSSTSTAVVSNVRQMNRIRLSNEDINRTYDYVVPFLYDTLELQCNQCGMRFASSGIGKTKLQEHLDWHFRQNRRAKDKGKSAVSRDWYLVESTWVMELEVKLAVKDRQLQGFFGEKSVEKEEVEVEKKNITLEEASGAKNLGACAICNEPFVKVYNDDEEVWMLENACLVDQKLYHYSCFTEFQEQKRKQKQLTPPSDAPETGTVKRKRDEEDLDTVMTTVDTEIKFEEKTEPDLKRLNILPFFFAILIHELLGPKLFDASIISLSAPRSSMDVPKWTLFKRWVWTKRDLIIGLVLILCNFLWWILPIVSRFSGRPIIFGDNRNGEIKNGITLRSLGDQISRKSAWAGMWNAALAIVFAVRENHILKAMLGSEASEYHKRIRFHIALGYACLFHMTFHTLWYLIAYTIDRTLETNMYPWLSNRGYFNFLGLISWLALCLMTFFSFSIVRRKKFVVFILFHQLYVVFLAAAFIHYQSSWYPMLGPILYFISDRLNPQILQKRAVKLHATKLNDKTILLQFPLSRRNYGYAPGDWCNIQIPSFSSLEWHPFSTASYYPISQNSCLLYVSVTGAWTKKLLASIENGKTEFDAKVDGFFGGRKTTYISYDTLVVVGGGSGMGALVPYVLHYLETNPDGKVRLIWITKQLGHAAAYESLVETFADKRVEVKIFETQGESNDAVTLVEHAEPVQTQISEKTILVNAGGKLERYNNTKPDNDTWNIETNRTQRAPTIILSATVFVAGITIYCLTRIFMTMYKSETCGNRSAFKLRGMDFFICFIYYPLAPPLFSAVGAILFGWILTFVIRPMSHVYQPKQINLSSNLCILQQTLTIKGRPDLEKVLGEILDEQSSAKKAVMAAGTESMVVDVEKIVMKRKDQVFFLRESFVV